jgi:hypothetical protein
MTYLLLLLALKNESCSFKFKMALKKMYTCEKKLRTSFKVSKL